MFEGAHTAIVTPFDKDGEVDYDRLRSLVEFQVEGGVDGMVPVGVSVNGDSDEYNTDRMEAWTGRRPAAERQARGFRLLGHQPVPSRTAVRRLSKRELFATIQ